jgi:hypothetical protein
LRRLEFAARLQAELFGEQSSSAIEHSKCIVPPALSVQTQHQLSTQSLTQRMFREGLRHVVDDVMVATTGQRGVGVCFDGGEVFLLEHRDELHTAGRVADLRERRTSPQPQGLAEEGFRGVRLTGRGPLDQLTEVVQVEGPRRNLQPVAVHGPDELDRCAGEHLAQLGHADLDELARGGRGIVVPENVHECLRSDRTTRVYQ